MTDKLQGLEADFRADVEELLEKCSAAGMPMVPYFALRTPHEQARLWRQSRPKSQIDDAIEMLRSNGARFLAGVLEGVGAQNGPHVTNALPGASWHQWGQALDCYWIVDGEVEWSATRKVNGKNGYQEYARLATAAGLDAGGLWNSLKDWPHVQKSKSASPLKAGSTWAEIDRAMEERFGSEPRNSMEFAGPVLASARSAGAPKLGFQSEHGWRTYYTDDFNAVVFRSRMTICADGAPKAYHSNNAVALDYLGNAGRPGNWWALATDNARPSGSPIVQSATDPAPGYYVSMTAMENGQYGYGNPKRYVDATTVPYVVLPGGDIYRQMHPVKAPRLGDLAVAYNTSNGLVVPAMFAEIGPADQIGEASIAVATALGVNANPKKGGIETRTIIYVVFPGTGSGRVLTPNEISQQGMQSFNDWGGLGRLTETRI